MQKIIIILSLFVVSSCGKQDLADRDDRRDDYHGDHRHYDNDRDDRDDNRPWWRW